MQTATMNHTVAQSLRLVDWLRYHLVIRPRARRHLYRMVGW